MTSTDLKLPSRWAFDDSNSPVNWNPDSWLTDAAVAADILGQTEATAHGDSKVRPGGGPVASTATATTTANVTDVTVASSPFKVDITWDSSVASAPAGFTTGVINAVQYLEGQIGSAVTVNIDVGYGEVTGTAMSSGSLGQSLYYLSSVSYSQLVSALKANSASPTDASVLASLPATSPVSGTYWITTAQAKALGLASATGTSTDGFIGFSSTYPFTYNDSGGVAAGTYDFNGTVLHEVSEVMGRMLLTGGPIGGTANSFSLLDLLHYSAPGIRDFSASVAGYFSPDGGTTNLGNFNTGAGDAGDWASSVANNAFDAMSASGVVNAVTPADLTELNAIGWNPAGSAPTPSAPTGMPTGVSLSAITGSLAAAQGTNGLNAGITLAEVTQTGGPTTDSYTYSLGGAAAGAFSLSTASNLATLSTGTSGVAGSSGGALDSLTVTATDTKSGNAAAAVPINVVIGSGGSDIIDLTSLPGITTSALTFIYGLGGNDTIDATGMSGKLYIDGGAGADIMTGGSGTNDVVYGAVSDSTSTSMDVIQNFNAATNLMDFTGIGTSLQYDGAIKAKGKGADILAAKSIGFQANGGNTYVYVNTSGSSESIAGTNMKIDLRGSLSLSSSNFLHA